MSERIAQLEGAVEHQLQQQVGVMEDRPRPAELAGTHCVSVLRECGSLVTIRSN